MTATDDFIRELRAQADIAAPSPSAPPLVHALAKDIARREFGRLDPTTLTLLLDIVAAATSVDSSTHRHMPPVICLDCDGLSRDLDALEAHLKERAK